MDNRVPVYCSFNKEIYDACDVVTALIRAPACPEAVVFAQALGILQVDGRWVRVPTTYHNGENIVTDSLILPESLKNSSCMSVLIFSTILEPLAYTHICDEGVYVQFELPNDTLPTFVGIAGSIAYFINITIQFPTQALHCHFDFRVFGPGSNTLNYKRAKSMAVFAASSMSYCTLISADPNPGQSTGNCHDIEEVAMMHGGNSPPTYLISDKEALCSVKFLTVPAYGFSSSRLLMGDKMSSQARKQVVRGLVRPGDVLRVSLDFTAARQLSTMVRVRLLQKETHPDGTRLQKPRVRRQEKVLDEHVRVTEHALQLTLPLRIPRNIPPAFFSPVFFVDFFVELEFFVVDESSLGKERGGDFALNSSEEPLVWSIGLDISSPSSAPLEQIEAGAGTGRSGGADGGCCHYVDPDTVMIEYAV